MSVHGNTLIDDNPETLTELMETQPIELTDADFSARMQETDGIILFYKKICPHCKALKKVIEKVVADNPDLTVMQVDSEANPNAMAELEIKRVPTLLLTGGGQILQRKAGLINARQLKTLLQSV